MTILGTVLSSRPRKESSTGSKSGNSASVTSSVAGKIRAARSARINKTVTAVMSMMRVHRKPEKWELDNITPHLYDDNVHTEYLSTVLSKDKIIAVEPHDSEKMEGSEKDPPPGIFRFTTDIRAKAVDLAEIACVAASVFVFPLTFLHGGSWEEPDMLPGGRGLLILDALIDFVYFLTMAFDFNVSYLHRRKGYEVVGRRRICKHIMSNPLFWLSLFSCTCPIWIAVGAPALINNVKLVRLRHVLDLPDSMWYYRDQAWARLSRPVLLLVVSSHWLACLLSYFGGFRDQLASKGEAAFETSFGTSKVNGQFSLYLTALVEGVYLLTGGLDNPVGDGGIRDKQFGALFLVCIFGPVGCVVASLLTATLANEMAMANALQAKHVENKAFMSHALRILNIPKPLRKRVFSQYYFQKMGHDVEAFDALFNKKNLSLALENALLVYLYKDTVITSVHFRNRDPNYVIEVLRVMVFQVYLPGDYVARCGEIAFTMYFVSKGELALLVPSSVPALARDVKHAKEVKRFKTGDNFGEIALIRNTTRSAWVRADDYSVLSALDRDPVERVWFHFPEEKQKIVDQVRQHKLQDAKRARDAKMKKGMAKVRNVVRLAHGKTDGKLMDHDHLTLAQTDESEDGIRVGRFATEVVSSSSGSEASGHVGENVSNETTVVFGAVEGLGLGIGERGTRRGSAAFAPTSSKRSRAARPDHIDRVGIQVVLEKIMERQTAMERTLKKVLTKLDGPHARPPKGFHVRMSNNQAGLPPRAVRGRAQVNNHTGSGTPRALGGAASGTPRAQGGAASGFAPISSERRPPGNASAAPAVGTDGSASGGAHAAVAAVAKGQTGSSGATIKSAVAGHVVGSRMRNWRDKDKDRINKKRGKDQEAGAAAAAAASEETGGAGGHEAAMASLALPTSAVPSPVSTPRATWRAARSPRAFVQARAQAQEEAAAIGQVNRASRSL